MQNNGCITVRHVFNLIIVETMLQDDPTSTPERWSTSRFVEDAALELARLTGTAPDEDDYVVNLARTVQLLLTVLQVVHLVRRLDDSQISSTDTKTITDFGEIMLKKEPASWC